MGEKDAKQLLHFYEDMLRIRFFEEKIRDVLLPQQLFRGSSHLYIGEEAVAVGAIHALREDEFNKAGGRAWMWQWLVWVRWA